MRYSVELRKYSEDGDDIAKTTMNSKQDRKQLHLRVKTEVRSIPY